MGFEEFRPEPVVLVEPPALIGPEQQLDGIKGGWLQSREGAKSRLDRNLAARGLLR